MNIYLIQFNIKIYKRLLSMAVDSDYTDIAKILIDNKLLDIIFLVI